VSPAQALDARLLTRAHVLVDPTAAAQQTKLKYTSSLLQILEIDLKMHSSAYVQTPVPHTFHVWVQFLIGRGAVTACMSECANQEALDL